MIFYRKLLILLNILAILAILFFYKEHLFIILFSILSIYLIIEYILPERYIEQINMFLMDFINYLNNQI